MNATARLLRFFALSLVVLVAIQWVPYGRDHSAPANGAQPAWDSPRTLELAQRACFDCHSNETRWPWYSHVAPVSWRVFRHVEEGRQKLNFSALDVGNEDGAHAAGEAGEEVAKRAMPPADYLLAHPEARLTEAERRVLATGLDATFSAFVGSKDGERSEHGRPR